MDFQRLTFSRWVSTLLCSLAFSIASSVITGVITRNASSAMLTWIIASSALLSFFSKVDIFSIKWMRKIFGSATIFDWDDVNQGTLSINKRLLEDGYIPTHIVGTGRGGSILSALISGNLLKDRHIPFSSFDRKYFKDGMGMRKAELLQGIDLGHCDLTRVLLVAGDVVTGITAQRFKEFLISKGAQDIRFAVLAKCPNPAMEPDYFYKEFLSEKGLHFPWMICSNYTRYCTEKGEKMKI